MPLGSCCTWTKQLKTAHPDPRTLLVGVQQDLISADADLAAAFGRARFLVLDEADRLLEKSFEGELAVIARALPERRQTLLFSATLTRSMALLQASALRDAYLFQAGFCWPALHRVTGTALGAAWQDCRQGLLCDGYLLFPGGWQGA